LEVIIQIKGYPYKRMTFSVMSNIWHAFNTIEEFVVALSTKFLTRECFQNW